MPHFSIEYSADLDDRVDIGAMCEVVRRAAAATGVFPLGGIRVRAIRCEQYAIADGVIEASFVAVLARIGEGRALADQQRGGGEVFEALSAFLEPVFADRPLALSLDLQVNAADKSWKRNTIHERLADGS
jgi:5-carboxymethyl-2-hydroxymuconate isomerase